MENTTATTTSDTTTASSATKFVCTYRENCRKPIFVERFKDLFDIVKHKFSKAPGFNPETMIIQYEDEEEGYLDLDDVKDLFDRKSNTLRIFCLPATTSTTNPAESKQQENNDLSEASASYDVAVSSNMSDDFDDSDNELDSDREERE